MQIFLGTLFILICILLIAIILLQKGRGGGLAGAFGGAGGHSAFGSRTGDMFTWVTVVLMALFILLGVAAVRQFRPATAPPPPANVVTKQAPATAPAASEPAEEAVPASEPTTSAPATTSAPTTAPAVAPVAPAAPR